MKKNHAKRASEPGRGQQKKPPQLPPPYDIEAVKGESNGAINLGSGDYIPLPPNGPKQSGIGVWIVLGTFVCFALWASLGFYWLFRTGDSQVLKTSSIAGAAFGVAAAIYSEELRARIKRPRRGQEQLDTQNFMAHSRRKPE